MPRGKIYMSEDIDIREVKLQEMISLINDFQELGLYLDMVDFPTYLVFDLTGYGGIVPRYLRNSRVTNLDESVTKVIWSDWKAVNRGHRELDGMFYVPLTSGSGGQHVSVSMLARLKGEGYTVRSMKSYPELPELEGEI